ncbi:MAG: hypothetical protein OEZ13_10955 [Spirochaetia bacterium]|nr:hypothetical protein [Spirochaetia bacterium]
MPENNQTLLYQDGINLNYAALPENIKAEVFSGANYEHIFSRHKNASFLLVRADFAVNEKTVRYLSSLKTIGLVSTGDDNIDQNFLKEKNIKFVSAKGANAQAVADYVKEALLYFWLKYPEKQNEPVGIIGYGNIGLKVGQFLERAKQPFFYYDPFLKNTGDVKNALKCPIVTFHVPLTFKESNHRHATENMLDENYFTDEPPYIIQTSRGRIWNKQFYEHCLFENKIWAQDVYYDEPPIKEWVLSANFSTPHIAGYSTNGKTGGALKVIKEILPGAAVKEIPKGEIFSLQRESDEFKNDSRHFEKRRLSFSLKKELNDFNAAERKFFFEKFSNLPQRILTACFNG